MSAEIYTLCSSSKGNCCLIRNGDDLFLIDAGASARRIFSAVREIGYDPGSIRAVFLTHEHGDHIHGLEVLYHSLSVPLYAPSACMPELLRVAPTAASHYSCGDQGEIVTLQQTRVCPVRTPHDSLGSVGFRISFGEELFAYFTDIGHLTADIVRAMSGCRRIVIESNYDPFLLENGPYPYPLKQRIAGPRGHLSNPECASLIPHLIAHGTERILLAHLSETNNTPETARAAATAELQDPSVIEVAAPADITAL